MTRHQIGVWEGNSRDRTPLPEKDQLEEKAKAEWNEIRRIVIEKRKEAADAFTQIITNGWQAQHMVSAHKSKGTGLMVMDRHRVGMPI